MPKYDIELMVRVDAKDAIEANRIVRGVLEEQDAVKGTAIIMTEEQD